MARKSFSFMASAKSFNNGKVDTNGLAPVALIPLTGKSPRGLNVISGTSANLYGVEVGNCYAMRATEVVAGDKGHSADYADQRQFQFQMLAPVDTFKAVEAGIKSPAVILIQNGESITEDAESTPVEEEA